MREQYDEIRRLGGAVLVVSFEPVDRLPYYRDLHGWPFSIVSDSDRAAYRAFGLGAATWGELFGPRVLLQYARLTLAGYRPRASAADVHQLGGDFVLDRARRIIFAHRSKDPVDRPSASVLVASVRSCQAGGSV